MIIESVRKFISTCPYLPEFSAAVNAEYLGEAVKSYMVQSVPAEPIVKRYVDGSSVRRFVFYFAGREYYGPDVIENIENSGFYEHFSEWLEKCTLKGELPEMGAGKGARKIRATTTGYVFNESETEAMYQIQCELIYYQERMI